MLLSAHKIPVPGQALTICGVVRLLLKALSCFLCPSFGITRFPHPRKRQPPPWHRLAAQHLHETRAALCVHQIPVSSVETKRKA